MSWQRRASLRVPQSVDLLYRAIRAEGHIENEQPIKNNLVGNIRVTCRSDFGRFVPLLRGGWPREAYQEKKAAYKIPFHGFILHSWSMFVPAIACFIGGQSFRIGLRKGPGFSGNPGGSASRLRSRDATLSRRSANPRTQTGHRSLPAGLRYARPAALWRL
jgi:hypothetical protein